MPRPVPSSEGSPLSPRHRPDVKSLIKNSTELDLWDIDELPVETSEKSPAALPRRHLPSTLAPLPIADPPQPKDTDATPPPQSHEIPILPRHKSSQNLNVERRSRLGTSQPAAAPHDPPTPLEPHLKKDTLEDTFDNLEDWNLVGAPPHHASEPPLRIIPIATAEDAATAQAQAPPAPNPVPAPTPAASTPAATPAAAASDRDEFSPAFNPNAKPLSLRPKLALSKWELGGLIVLAVVLLAGGFWVYENSLSRLRNQATSTRKITFPVQGDYLTLTKVITYWRAPVSKKGQVETVRRGVVLIPVTELTLRGGPAAIRLLVHNSNGTAVGDSITRQVNGETTLTIPATDGFDDITMHAVYLTDQAKPWTIHLFEAPTADAPRQDYKKLLELPISTEKR